VAWRNTRCIYLATICPIQIHGGKSRTGVVVGGFRLPIKGMTDNPTWKPFNPTGGEISKGTLQNQKCSGTCFWSIKTKVQVKCLHVYYILK
jgi:hypothetical protein